LHIDKAIIFLKNIVVAFENYNSMYIY